MAGNRKFHNKFHSANHHTLPSPHIIDSGLDPIASHDFPFIGDFVLNGTLSSSNNYLLNGPRKRTLTLDDVPHGMNPIDLGLPGNWNILRDSTYIDGDAVITGNLSAVGELTYLHTQVYSTSANEIDVRANNSNGKSIGLRVDQYGTNDVLHVYNDAVSTLIITGSADQPVGSGDARNIGGQIGINLGSLDDIDRPNQRMTIVGSVSVVGDPYEYLSQEQQIDPGVTGSLYIEGGLHVNDKTFLDQVTVDTTDGKFYVSGAGVPGSENPVDIDVPTLLDRTTVDTTDGDMYVTGTNRVYIDTDKGLEVDTHSQLDQVTVDTTDGDMLIEGSNWLRVEVPGDFNKHVNLDRVHVDTTDGNFVVSGSNKMYIEADGGLDVNTHTQLDQVTVVTDDGKFLIKGNNILDVEADTELDKLTVDTNKGDTLIKGSGTFKIETYTHMDTTFGKLYINGNQGVDIDTFTHLDQVTVDTQDGAMLITHPSNVYTDRNPLNVNVPANLTQTTVDTTSGDFSVVGDGDFIVDAEGKFIVESDSEMNKLTVDVTNGDFLIKGKNSGNIFDVNVNSSFNDGTLSAGAVHITTAADEKDMLVDGSGRVDYKTEVFFDNAVELDATTIDTQDGEFVIENTDWEEGKVSWENTQEMRVKVPSIFESLTANSQNQELIFHGENKTKFYTPVDFYAPVAFRDDVEMSGHLFVNNLTVSGLSHLAETHINTTTGDLIVSGTGKTNIQTYTVFDDSVYIKGNLRVDGNAWLSAGYDGDIHVGDSDGDRVLFHADVDSDVLPNITDTYRFGRPGKRWLDVASHTGTFHEVFVDNSLMVEGKTHLDETEIITDDGDFIISGSNPTTFYTDVNINGDLTLKGQLSATEGPWIFTGCKRQELYLSGSVNPVDQTAGSVDNVAITSLPYHQFQVDCNSLFTKGLTANGPVQIGELPEGVTDELYEPTLEVLGNLHVREGNIKIVSDLRHLDDEHTLMRFKPDCIEFRAADKHMLSLCSSIDRNLVSVGDENTPVDLVVYKDSPDRPQAIAFDSSTGETVFDGNIGVFGANEAAPVIGEGVDVHGSVRVTETLSAKNLIVDYITVQESSFGNIGGAGTGGGAELSPVSGIAPADHTSIQYVEGETIEYAGTPVGIEFDITKEQNTIQKLFSFTFEALSANEDLGIVVGDVQSTTYQFAAKWDEYWSEAFVNDVEYGIVHTSANPFAEVTAVVLSAEHVPTNERIVKIVVKPTVDCKFFSHNVLAQTKPKRLDTVTTADFDVNGDLSVFGQVSAAKGLTVDGDHLLKGEVTYLSGATFKHDVLFEKDITVRGDANIKDLSIDEDLHVKGSLRVDGNTWLSGGTNGMINVGDQDSDIVIFQADIGSDLIPDQDSKFNIGTKDKRWNTVYSRNLSANGMLELSGRQVIYGEEEQYFYFHPETQLDDIDVDGTDYYFHPLLPSETVPAPSVIKGFTKSESQSITGVTIETETGDKTLQIEPTYSGGSGEHGGKTYTIYEQFFSSQNKWIGQNYTVNSYHSDTGEQGDVYFIPMSRYDTDLSGVADDYLIQTSPHGDLPQDEVLRIETISGVTEPLGSLNFINVVGSNEYELTQNISSITVDASITARVNSQDDESKMSWILSITQNDCVYSYHFDDLSDTDAVFNTTDVTHQIRPEDTNKIWDPLGTGPDQPTFNSGDKIKLGFFFANGDEVDQRNEIEIAQASFGLDIGVSNPSEPVIVPGDYYIRSIDWELARLTRVWDPLTVFGNSRLSGDVVVDQNMHIKGDLRVDGNAWLSAGADGVINVGDKNTDSVIFHADVDSDLIPDDDVKYTLGTEEQRWLDLHVEDVSATGRGHFEGHSTSLSAQEYIGNIQHAGGVVTPASQAVGGYGTYTYNGSPEEEKYAYDGDDSTYTGYYKCWWTSSNQQSKVWTTYTFPTPVTGTLVVKWRHIAYEHSQVEPERGSWKVQWRESATAGWRTLRNLANYAAPNVWTDRTETLDTGSLPVYQVRVWQHDIGRGALAFAVREISTTPAAGVDVPLNPGDSPIMRWMLRDDNSEQNTRLINYLQDTPATYETDITSVDGEQTVLSFYKLQDYITSVVSEGLNEQEEVLIYGYGEYEPESGLPIYLQNFTNVHANSASILINKYIKPEPTLIVDGEADLNGDVDIRDNLVVNGDVLTVGNTTLSGTLDVALATTLNDTLNVSGRTTIDDALDVTSNTTLSGTLEVDLATTLNDTLNVSGRTTIDDALDVTSNTTLSGTLEVDLDTNLKGRLDVQDATTLHSTLDVTDNTTLHGDLLDVHGDTEMHGHLHVQQSVDVDGPTHLKNTLDVDLETTLHGETTVDDDLYVTGVTRLSGHTEIDDDLNITGNMTLSGTIDVEQAATLENTLRVKDDTTLEAKLHVEDSATFDKNVHIKGDLRVDGNAYLSAGSGGAINVGDTDDDVVLFHADAGSDILPDITDTYNLGASDKSWNEVHWKGGNSLESNSVYDFVNTTSGEWGYANLSAYQDDTYVLRHDQVPPLAITHVRRVTNSSLVTTLKDLVYRGDIVLVADTEDNLVAIVDHPTGEYDKDIAEYAGYERLFAPGNMVRFINGHQGPSVILDPDDLDDSETDHKFIAQGELDNIHSIWSSLTSTSGNWDSVYTTVGDSSAHWYEVYNNVAATSADRDSVYVSVNSTSADWDDARTTLNASSADWYDARTTLNTSSGDWYDTRASVMETSGSWDSVYNFVNADSATNNTTYNQSTFVNASGDTITGDLNITGKVHGNTAYFTSLTALSSYIDVVDIRVRELSGFDIIDGDLTVQGDISATGDIYLDKNSLIFSDGERFNSQDSKNAKSVYNTVLTSSADWYDARTTLNASSADWYDTRTSVMETSGDWNDARTTLNASSADWYDARTTLNASSADWYDARTTLNTSSADWYDTRTSVMETSGEWDSVYDLVHTTSGYGYATVGIDGKLEEHLVPNLSITETYVVTYDSSVEELCNGTLQGVVDIERGDVVIITQTEQNLIAVVDNPTGVYHQGFDTFDGFSKLQTPTDYIKTINGKQGLMVVLNPDDLDDTSTAHKFVDELQKYNWDSTFSTVCAASANWNSVYTSVNETSGEWDSVYSFVNSDSATNNTDYNQTTFVNASGDTVTGDLVIEKTLTVEGDTHLESTAYVSTLDVSGNTILNTLSVSGATELDSTLDVHDDSVFHKNVYIKGDLRVDGNAFLSAGVDGNINVGDADTDNVVFRADVDSDFLADKKDVYTLGSETKRWLATYSLSGLFEYVEIHDLNVDGVATFKGKTDRGPGVVIKGTPTGLFDLDPYGFEDLGTPRPDYMLPDVDITGDVAVHGSLSAENAHIFSLTASHFKAEYEKLTVNDGDIEMLNGSFRQRGGNMWIESDLGHIDDENTYMRFQPDEITFTCHDVQMLKFQELTTGDDVITVGDISDSVDLVVQNPTDNNTLFIDGDTGYIGIGTNTPVEKLHVEHGQVQLATGDRDGALMITSGTTQERVDKTGSIRWNSELNRYEGYNDDTKSWVAFGGMGDSDGDTYISVDAGDYPDSDRLALYTVGCSAMTIYPNQTVAFAGDIQFDNITIYDNNSVTGPLTATTEFIYLKVNGKDRAIRLWATPEDTREDIETFHGESVTHIGDECGLGHGGQIPTQTISAHPVLNNPPTQRTDVDSDGDGIIDYLDPDDDNDGIPDFADDDHPMNKSPIDEPDSDSDGIIDKYDPDAFSNTTIWEHGVELPWENYVFPWETRGPNNKY